jgi:signal transduction histidine kinase/ActR/RegA family two-component response regulator
MASCKLESEEASLQNKDGLNLPLARDGECASQGAAAAGSTDRQGGAPDRQRSGVPAETALPRKSEYLPNVSHRIRTPLHAIMGLAESLSETELSMEQRTMVRLLRTSADSLLGAVDNLFDFSLLETGQIKLACDSFDLEQLMGDMFRALDVPARQRGLRLRSEIRQDVPLLLRGDARRLRQVVTSLVTNAIQFTHVGQICMTVSVATRNPGGLTLHFVVSDTGIGIAEDRQSAVFQPFVQVDGSDTRTHRGLGLGLRIAVKLVELMKGEIWVESALDQGSRFNFTANFGLTPAAEVPDAPVQRLATPIPLRPGTILLAEDNYINQMVTVRILEGKGHRVVVGANGRLALEILERQAVDLVLMDIQMPEMDGFQATRAIRESEAFTGAHLPIVALTAHATNGYRQKCLDAGMDDYLAKPVCSKDLLEVVNRTLTGIQTVARA